MRKIVFVNDEKQTEYRDIPANVFDAVENLMDTYGDIYSDISRDKIDCEHTDCNNCVNHKYCDYESNCSEIPTGSTSKNDLGVREFVEIVVEYPPEDLCTYPEYKGKPYFSIKYEEGNDCIIGYGTYNPQVLSRYLKDYFMPTTKNDLGVDCVSRKEVFEAIDDCNSDGLKGIFCSYDDGERFKEYIKNLPSVTPQPCKDAVSRKDVHDMLENLPITVEDKWFNWLQKACMRLAELPSVTPQEPCEDVISRKSIKQKLQEHHDFFVNAYGGFSNLPQNDKSRVDEITNCIAMVVNEPSVTPQEPRKGHWILRNSFLVPYKCSECNYKSERYDNYCPNCGCRMVEPQESEDKA